MKMLLKNDNIGKLRKSAFFCFLGVMLFIFCLIISVHAVTHEQNEKVSASFVDENNKKIANFNLAIADTNEERAKGLMYVKSLAKNEGMLFAYDEDIIMYFWMKNTYIPLDIVFLNKNFKVIGIIENMIPMAEVDIKDDDIPRYTIGKKARYAVEIPAFSAKKYGVKVGYKLLGVKK